ncbi:zonular occludens toxin domain-containing protein [Suttonella ornithocola]|uniref:Zonula occludens toxin n=1 Tax=Suttonella ornithocola TaxID=279832 RepID=A0A380N0S9_9GAMM|nr:zonular occludens toxin domain-containing protein [Suttonella ornithocola]SUO97357.1 Zonula occludens toxin [Suttonella ornithocola]
MITLITAVPGSGKTLYAIGIIDAANKAGRAVYQNIDGLKPDMFDNPSIIFDAPADWRDTPDGSLIIYDECQQPHLYPANAKRGLVEDERLTAMETHRHTGHDLIFITQAPTFVHHHIRKLTGQHVHFYRARGIQGAMRYEWSHVCDNPNDRKEQQRADSVMWKFPKQYFDYYKSATIHTHKFSMPAKLKILLYFLIPAILYLGYRFSQFSMFSPDIPDTTGITDNQPKEISTIDSIQENKDIPDSPYNWANILETIPVMGCAANRKTNRCMCFGENGVTLHMQHAQCLSVLSNPLPRSISVSPSRKSQY